MADDGCKKITPTHRKVAVGALRHRVKLVSCVLTPPTFLADDNNIGLEKTVIKEVWADIKTLQSINLFNGANIGTIPTHYIFIRWYPGFQYDGYKYKIRHKTKGTNIEQHYLVLDSNNYEDRNEFIQLTCALQGREEDTQEDPGNG